MTARSLVMIVALMSAVPALAQTSDSSDPAHVAADAREVPQTQSLNNQVNSSVVKTEAVNAAAQAQYEADKAAYEQAMREHHREVLSTDATFIRQQQAYALAMRDWRAQVEMCRKGYKSACDLPPPDPMKYM